MRLGRAATFAFGVATSVAACSNGTTVGTDTGTAPTDGGETVDASGTVDAGGGTDAGEEVDAGGATDAGVDAASQEEDADLPDAGIAPPYGAPPDDDGGGPAPLYGAPPER